MGRFLWSFWCTKLSCTSVFERLAIVAESMSIHSTVRFRLQLRLLSATRLDNNVFCMFLLSCKAFNIFQKSCWVGFRKIRLLRLSTMTTTSWRHSWSDSSDVMLNLQVIDIDSINKKILYLAESSFVVFLATYHKTKKKGRNLTEKSEILYGVK